MYSRDEIKALTDKVLTMPGDPDQLHFTGSPYLRIKKMMVGAAFA